MAVEIALHGLCIVCCLLRCFQGHMILSGPIAHKAVALNVRVTWDSCLE